MLINHAKHGMVAEKLHEVISIKQSKWLKTYVDFNTNRRAEAGNYFDIDLHKTMNHSFYFKTTENDRFRLEVSFIKKHDNNKMMKMQLKLTLNRIDKFYDRNIPLQ